MWKDRVFETSAEANAAGGGGIFVSPSGDDTYGDGSLLSPFKKISKGLAQTTSSNLKVYAWAGSYDEDAQITWPHHNGVELVGLGGYVTITAPGATQVVSIDPNKASGTWSATLDHIEIEAGSGQIGLKVNNTNVGKRINLYLRNCPFSQDTATDASINIARAGSSGNAVRLYADGSGELIEGLVTVVFENTDDRIRFSGYRLVGGLTQTGAVAGEITLLRSTMKQGGFSYDAAAYITNIGCVYETDANPNVYTQFADAYSA